MFNPFEKELSDITIDDIRNLKEKKVSEGQYVEYKEDYPSNEKISHSIASFANSYGGWYIIGVKAVNNIADEFNGFKLNRYGNDLEKIRDIVRYHINPILQFDSRLIDLGTVLDGSRLGILVVQVHESDEPPHITKDGKIYRRNGSGSDPVPENDRYAIDKLYDKSDLTRKIERFCNNDITTSKADSENGWLEVYVMTYPLNVFQIDDFLQESQICELRDFLNNSSDTGASFSGSVPFNVVHPSHYSVLFRQTSPERIAHLGISYRQYFNGNCKIIIPFPYLPLTNFSIPTTELQKLLYSKIAETDLHLFKITDGQSLMTSYIILLMKHIEYLKLKGYDGKILLFHRLRNTWRNILFLDSLALKKQIESYGLPICLQDSGQSPLRITKEDLIENMPPLDLAKYLIHFSPIALYFGIFSNTFAEYVGEWIQKDKTQKDSKKI